jgi:hypothetical protein
MGVLNAKQRKASATIGKDRYPIPDAGHARAALGRINQGGLSPAQKAKVRARAYKFLPRPPKKIGSDGEHKNQ